MTYSIHAQALFKLESNILISNYIIFSAAICTSKCNFISLVNVIAVNSVTKIKCWTRLGLPNFWHFYIKDYFRIFFFLQTLAFWTNDTRIKFTSFLFEYTTHTSVFHKQLFVQNYYLFCLVSQFFFYLYTSLTVSPRQFHWPFLFDSVTKCNSTFSVSVYAVIGSIIIVSFIIGTSLGWLFPCLPSRPTTHSFLYKLTAQSYIMQYIPISEGSST